MKTLEELGVSGGDWNFHKRGQRIYGGKTEQLRIAQVHLCPEFDANGRLMAASKPMYDALLAAELAVAELCERQDPTNECWVTLATIREAIAAAGGA